jgi:polynucleotide 5'-kinase involved in rRNA processing
VDTTGLVDPSQGGKALKQWKIELRAPTTVIGLQRRQELEPILIRFGETHWDLQSQQE